MRSHCGPAGAEARAARLGVSLALIWWVHRIPMSFRPAGADGQSAGRRARQARLQAALAQRLAELAIPALVMHGRRDPFFPVGNGEALAREIPGARLLVLERAAWAMRDADAGEVATAMLSLS